MAFNMGVGSKLAIGKESAWGTPVADTMLVNFISESLAAAVSKVEEENLLAAKAAAAYDLMGIKVAGDFSAILKPENAGFFFKAALGGTDSVVQNQGGVTGQHQHTIIAQTAAGVLPSYTAVVDRKQAIKKYSGCKVDSLKMSAKAGDYVRVTLGMKGKDEASGTVTTSTPPSKKAYKMIGGTLTLGATAMDIMSVDLDYANALDDGVQTNTSGLYANEPVHGKRKIAITCEVPYDTNSESIRNTNFLTETLLSTVLLHLESPEIIVAASKYRMDITLNNVAVLDAKVNVGGAGLLVMSIKCEATAVSTTEPISAVIYDGTTAAYSGDR
jgi:hypothetical protein